MNAKIGSYGHLFFTQTEDLNKKNPAQIFSSPISVLFFIQDLFQNTNYSVFVFRSQLTNPGSVQKNANKHWWNGEVVDK